MEDWEVHSEADHSCYPSSCGHVVGGQECSIHWYRRDQSWRQHCVAADHLRDCRAGRESGTQWRQLCVDSHRFNGGAVQVAWTKGVWCSRGAGSSGEREFSVLNFAKFQGMEQLLEFCKVSIRGLN